MSIPVFIHQPDGTGWEGRINYNFTALRETNFKVDLEGNAFPAIEYLYRQYGVCSATRVNANVLSGTFSLDSLYVFLYGYSLGELMLEVPADKDDKFSFLKSTEWMHEPEPWTAERVKALDWDLFCIAYYIFLCSKNKFSTCIWRMLSEILDILKKDPQLLTDLLLKNGRPADLADFWNTIYDGLQKKVVLQLQESTCYTAFCSMKELKTFLPSDRYEFLENRCCMFLDTIARNRIDTAFNEKYSAKELINFNIELLFFYKEYFELNRIPETKVYVQNAVFELLCGKGDIFLEHDSIIEADGIYAAALKYAQTDLQTAQIAVKRSRIASTVSEKREERIREQAVREYVYKQKQEKIKRRKKRYDAFIHFLAIAVIICILAAVGSGILLLLGIEKNLALKILGVSGGVFGAICMYCVIESIYYKIKK